ncbi:hypothetical protein ACFPK5_00475 [Streptomyces beijiangensis]|uniref:hypothetical protein n=1 Tax=Streptomyces beijiangensis TaxID=163361 RepID=UPI003620D80E
MALAPDVLQVLAAFRPELRESMRETAHTDAPKTLVTAVTKALKERTAEQLVARVLRRWTAHGYAEKFETGRLERPVGAAVAMVRPPTECPDASCEDGELLADGVDRLADGEPCVLCIERGKDYKASHKAARDAKKEAAATAASRLLCPGCEQDRGTGGALCPRCVSGFENDIAGRQNEPPPTSPPCRRTRRRVSRRGSGRCPRRPRPARPRGRAGSTSSVSSWRRSSPRGPPPVRPTRCASTPWAATSTSAPRSPPASRRRPQPHRPCR